MAVFTTGDNNFAPCKWIVNQIPGEGTHTTITSALVNASPGDTIGIVGSSTPYTENLSLKSGVSLLGVGYNPVNITGKLTMNNPGTAFLVNLNLTTNSDYCISLSGAFSSAILLSNCFLNATNNTAVQVNNNQTGSGVVLQDCAGSATAGFGIFDIPSGNLFLENCYLNHGPGQSSSTASTISGGTLYASHCSFTNPITTSGTGGFDISYCVIWSSTLNTTCLTIGGSGTSNSYSNVYRSGTASAVSVSQTFNSYGDVFESSNANVITGAGTFNYFNPTFSGSSNGVNVTTQTGGQYIAARTNTAPAAGFLGERIVSTVAVGSAVALTTNTTANMTSISLTPGVWDVSLVNGFTTSSNPTATQFACAISSQSANFSGAVQGDSFIILPGANPPTSGVADMFMTIPSVRISVSATTTYYANVRAIFSAGNVSAYGRLSAVRIS